MKKTILMFAAAGLLLATPSCKKGENDPFLSLSSRKARFAGEWMLSGYNASSMNTEPDGDYQSSTSTLNGSTITTSYSDYDSNSGTTTTNTTTITLNTAEYVINKDGTWTREWSYTSVEENSYTDFWGDDIVETTTTVYTSNEEGDWSFLGAVKEGEVTYKKKERAILNTLTSTGSSSETVEIENTTQQTTTTNDNGTSTWTNNYYSGEVSTTYEIDQLKGKEMIWKTMESNSGTNGFSQGGTSSSTTNDVYTSDETWTWTHK